MKKLIYAAAFLFLGTIVLSSCKKDWTCDCGSEELTYTIKDKKKKDAEAECEGKVGNGLVSVSVNTGCSLK